MGIKEIFYDWGGFNTKLFYLINGIHGELYDKVMLIGTKLGYYKMFLLYFTIILFVAGFDLYRQKKFRRGIYLNCRDKWVNVLTTLLLAQVFSLVWVGPLKAYLHMQRPFVALPEGSVNILDSIRLAESPMASFPSGHSTFAMMMAASLWPVLNLPGKIIVCFYVLWVGISRVSIGVHFPADVILSCIMSFSAVYIISKIVDQSWLIIKKA
jgi:membrane-associated phospholipid phosphatase